LAWRRRAWREVAESARVASARLSVEDWRTAALGRLAHAPLTIGGPLYCDVVCAPRTGADAPKTADAPSR
jgi:hypothetical protein